MKNENMEIITMSKLILIVATTIILSGCGHQLPTQTAQINPDLTKPPIPYPASVAVQVRPNSNVLLQGPTDAGFGNPPVASTAGKVVI